MRAFLFLTAALVLALLAAQDAALAYWRSDGGRTVPAIWQDDPVVRLRASEALLARPQDLRDQAQPVARAAREVLRQTPLDVQALRQLGIIAELDRPGSGRGYIALAERVSRRDYQTEILSIDYAATGNDAAATLRHYHHVLSAFPLANERLLPILASQLGEPDVRRALLAYADRPWLREFVARAVEYDVPPAALVEFYGEIEGRVPQADLEAGSFRLIHWLAGNGLYPVLESYARRLPGLPLDAFAQIGFDPVTTDPRYVPLSWAFVNDATIDTQVDGKALAVQVEPGSAAFAASRITLLKPGRYEFSDTVSFQPEAARARLDWRVTCPELASGPLLAGEPGGSTSDGLRRLALTVPEGCTAQFWQLRVAAAPSQYAASATVSDLALVKR